MRDTSGDEIEITAAMIEAGLAAYWAHDGYFETDEEGVRQIFVAMLSARNRSASCSDQRQHPGSLTNAREYDSPCIRRDMIAPRYTGGATMPRGIPNKKGPGRPKTKSKAARAKTSATKTMARKTKAPARKKK